MELEKEIKKEIWVEELKIIEEVVTEKKTYSFCIRDEYDGGEA